MSSDKTDLSWLLIVTIPLAILVMVLILAPIAFSPLLMVMIVPLLPFLLLLLIPKRVWMTGAMCALGITIAGVVLLIGILVLIFKKA